MASSVDAAGVPVPTSSVLMPAAKHIHTKCRTENLAFLKCKKNDPNPETCLDKGRQVTECVLHLLQLSLIAHKYQHICLKPASIYVINFKCSSGMPRSSLKSISTLRDLHQTCGKELDAYSGCMYYHTNEFDFCRKEQKDFEKACPL